MRVQVSARSGTITPNSSDPKPRARFGPALQEILDLLIDRDSLGPSGRGVRTALDVAGEQLDAGQQAAHAAHVVVAVAAKLVADAVEDQRAIAERLQRLEALLELERCPFLVGPERLWARRRWG